MRILYFNYLYDIYGASLGSAIKPMELFAALRKMGHDVELVWFKDQPGGPPAGTLKRSLRDFFKRHLAFLVHDLKLLLENRKFARIEAAKVAAFKPDILMARLDLYLYSAIKTARKFDLPVIIEADSPPLYEALHFQRQYWRIPAIPRLIERWVLRHADFSVMQSRELQRWFLDQHKLDPERTAVVCNGADADKFSPQPAARALADRFGLNGGPVLGFIGSMSAWHGIDNLLRIVQAIVAKYPQTRFLLVGSGGGQEKPIRRYLEKHGLTRHVIQTGYVAHAEIPDYLQLMDVVLAPYPNLPFFYYSPVKVFEYMAAGKAVVTTRIGQLARIIRDGWDGVLCPPNDLEAFISAISGLLEDPEIAREMGRHARESIIQQHTWKHKALAYEKICQQVIDAHRLRGAAGEDGR
ncbi:MAG TPA: glycosyltransferase family 4 protein [bacterium]|nr:glycosyltransferase family 4 protein [bacterium]